MKLVIDGDFELKKMNIEIPGFYVWKSEINNDWDFGYLVKGDCISGQYVGCGPLFFKEIRN